MENFKNLGVRELQNRLRQRGLPYYYKRKVDLVQRLGKALQVDQTGNSTEGTTEEDFSTDSDEMQSAGENKSIRENREKEGTSAGSTNAEIENHFKMIASTSNNFVFRDVEESLDIFDGETKRDVISWLNTFKDVANVCGWNNAQKYLYARRLLRGAAKLAVEAMTDIHHWENLEKFLKKEFSRRVTAIEIHRALENRKKKHDESFLQYMYSMKLIARDQVDERSLITYIIEGIQDNVLNKTLLYEATSLDELKEKFISYQNMKAKINKHTEIKSTQKLNKNVHPKKRCAGCGGKSHLVEACPYKDQGPRCFRCNEFGHIAPNCSQRRNKESSNSRVNIIQVPDMHIKVYLNDSAFLALVDTGSDVTLIRSSVSKILNKKMCTYSRAFLTGFGQTLRRTLGNVNEEEVLQISQAL